MTSKLGNPHFPPELCIKTTILNFLVTIEGLEDQMMNIIIQKEEPLKEELRQSNIKEFYQYKNR